MANTAGPEKQLVAQLRERDAQLKVALDALYIMTVNMEKAEDPNALIAGVSLLKEKGYDMSNADTLGQILLLAIEAAEASEG